MVEISESDKTLDVRGLYCPSPVMQTVVELAKMQVGQILVVLADDPAAEDGNIGKNQALKIMTSLL